MGRNGFTIMSKDTVTKNTAIKLVMLNNYGALTVWTGKIIKVHCALFYSLSKVDMTSTLRVNAANTARTKPTTGDTKMSFVNTDHLGWMLCDGRSLDTTAYNLLFQVVGYTFGGSGNSFNLPNPAGRVMGTIGTVTDVDARSRTYTAGQMVGELDHKLIQSEMPSHNHDINGAQYTNTPVTANGNTSSSTTGITHNATGPLAPGTSGYGLIYQDSRSTMNASTNNGDAEPNLYTSSTALVLTDPGHTHQIKSNGGDQYHNNIQPTLFYGNTFIYCGIPMVGNFPFKTGLAPVLI